MRARADIQDNGDAQVTVQLQLADATTGRFVVPLGFSNVSEFKVLDAPAGVQVTAHGLGTKEAGALAIEVQSGATGVIPVNVMFTVTGLLFRPPVAEGQKPTLAADSRLLQYSLLNTQPIAINNFEAEFRLPNDIRVQKIREQLPKPKKTEVLPRVRLDRFDGQQGALLQIKSLKQGDKTSIALEVMNAGRSLGWLLVGLVLSVAYLIGFRDLVTSKINSPNDTRAGAANL
jgi:hypothetical protein